MSETKPTENVPRQIDLAYLEFVDRKTSWAEASYRLDSGFSVSTTIDVSWFDSDPEAKAHRIIPVRPPPLTHYMPYPRPIAAIVPVPRKPETEYDENDDLPVIEDILSNISDFPDLEEVIEITVDHDLSELEDFASDTEEMLPLEEVIEITIDHDLSDTEEMPTLEPEDVPYDAPLRRDKSRYVRAQQLAEIEYFMDPINALERSKY